MTPAAVRLALNTNLATITGLNTYATIQAKPEPPCAIVIPEQPFAVPETMGRGRFSWYFRVLVLTGSVEDSSAQDALDGYCATSGSGSVLAAIESDKTLADSNTNSTVQEIASYGDVEWNELRYWGADLRVHVITTG